MSTLLKALESAKNEGASAECGRQRKKVTMRGKVLSLMRANGEWVAIVQAIRAKQGEPVISRIVPISALRGSARRKADRWLAELA